MFTKFFNVMFAVMFAVLSFFAVSSVFADKGGVKHNPTPVPTVEVTAVPEVTEEAVANGSHTADNSDKPGKSNPDENGKGPERDNGADDPAGEEAPHSNNGCGNDSDGLDDNEGNGCHHKKTSTPEPETTPESTPEVTEEPCVGDCGTSIVVKTPTPEITVEPPCTENCGTVEPPCVGDCGTVEPPCVGDCGTTIIVIKTPTPTPTPCVGDCGTTTLIDGCVGDCDTTITVDKTPTPEITITTTTKLDCPITTVTNTVYFTNTVLVRDDSSTVSISNTAETNDNLPETLPVTGGDNSVCWPIPWAGFAMVLAAVAILAGLGGYKLGRRSR
jgi:hypothetical protein